jgi:NitT/TauT family transport system permease protein
MEKTAAIENKNSVSIGTGKKKKRKENSGKWIKWIPAILILAIWELGSGVFLDENNYSSPSAVITRFFQDMSDGILIKHATTTFSEVFLGLLFGVLVGGVLGYFSGVSRKVAEVVEPYAMLLNSIPKVAIAPLTIIWFGIGPTSKIVMAALLVFFGFFFHIFVAVRAINNEYILLARLMGASRWKVVWKVVIPFIIPNVIVGLKQGIVFAVIGALVAEFIATSRGIGYYIQSATGSFDTTGVFVGVLILMLTVLIVNGILDLLQRKYLKWVPRRK